jgi:hypothetical protein
MAKNKTRLILVNYSLANVDEYDIEDMFSEGGNSQKMPQYFRNGLIRHPFQEPPFSRHYYR